MQQRIRFCRGREGARIAYATSGDGPPLIKTANWLTNLEYDWNSPVWRHWLEALSGRFELIRYDQAGFGLSDWDVEGFSLDDWVDDIETVVDEGTPPPFAMLGISAGGPTAIAYAARHPERVSALILYGSYALGRYRRVGGGERERADALLAMLRTGWGDDNPAFRNAFATLFMPDATPEQVRWFDDLRRWSTSPVNAVRFEDSVFDLDVTELASSLTVPTIVLHARDDAMVPVREGRRLARLIPGSEFVMLESHNHILVEDEPAWPHFLAAVDDFVAHLHRAPRREARRVDALTAREREVLELVARGASNTEISRDLVISPATLRNHITSIFRKLEARDRAQAIVIAREAGLGRSERPAFRQ